MKKRIIFILIFTLILLSYPYILCRMITLPKASILYFLFGCIFYFFCQKEKGNSVLPTIVRKCCMAQAAMFIILFVLHLDENYIYRILLLFDTYMILKILVKKGWLIDFVKANNYLIAIQAVMGFVAFFLIFFNVIQPLFIFDNVGDVPAYCYGLTCTGAVWGNICRVAGYFDEPGALAFWGIYSLIINKLFIKNNKLEYCLIIGLFATWSMAYYIQIAFYFLFFYHKKIKYLVPFILFVGIAVQYIDNNKNGDTELLYNFTYGRFEKNSSGAIETNRDEMTVAAKRAFLSSPLFGIGEKRTWSIGYLDDNPYEPLAKDGIIGTIFLYLPLFILVVSKRKDKEILLAILILFLGYLQRPFHGHILHYLMLYLFFLLSYTKIYNKELRKLCAR